MNNKKFKILLIVDIALIIGLFALMMILKGTYNDQAQKSVGEQVGAYLEQSNGVVQEQWKAVDQYGMAWKLVFATLTGDKTEATFDATAKAIEEDKDARFKQLSYMYNAAGIPPQAQNSIYEKAGLADKFLLKNEGGVKEVACGKNCVISFTFAKGKLKTADYKALTEYNMGANFKLEAPAPYHFE
ncbi:hypothetical protein SAMN05720766_10585 [Fibrobacter sp. UWH9]|uniref:hypothetical protein n=1 Tax=unclassified Fibrobacter TaxID=2634177 RepID=UPI00091858FC|nr:MULTISPECIES: hypothetical protein [Fibrobacter]MCQ2100545.1 hypothetical protein [Fibrobacter sp.]MCL4100755.1 hypothetical protein [Fibrobacter succinogenes]MDO4946878.1 hypothetical protein [Fibrobacter sp.]OWV07052.1 hypothetical protein B7992_14590 [Fibrobacter sp. UWH1]OWV08234.1 hypothetical protein B7993_00975 [Fibrobacter sp. UWH3]